jgi:hypothetical protein
MAQVQSHLPASQLSVEQTAAAINGMIAERAADRLREPPLAEPPAEAPKTPAPLEPHAPGIVFGMPAADYHRDPSLGSTGLKRLLRSPSDYWWGSHLNPDRPLDNDAPAKQKGRALHKLVLEGEEAFAKAFIEEPQPNGHPGCLVTLEDLKAKCRDLGEPVSGTKADGGGNHASRQTDQAGPAAAGVVASPAEAGWGQPAAGASGRCQIRMAAHPARTLCRRRR